jgi:hypothetical protein
MRPLWRQCSVVSSLVLVLALVAGASVAGARGNSRAPSLNIALPASMARGSVLTVKATGYSGPYNTVSWSSPHGGPACEGPNIDTIGTQAVRKGHTFNVKFTNIFGGPGTLTVCVYLFAGGSHANVTKGHYILKTKRVKVS